MNGTVVVIQDFYTKKSCVRNGIHEGCYGNIRSPSAYSADLCDICIHFLIREGRICSYCCGEVAMDLSLTAEKASGASIFSVDCNSLLFLLWGLWLEHLLSALNYEMELGTTKSKIQCIFIIIYLYYHQSWKASPWATSYYPGPWTNTQQDIDMLKFYIKRQWRDYDRVQMQWHSTTVICIGINTPAI